MIIGVAGPVSAPTKEEQQRNLDKLNEAAARLLEMGHVPLVGMNAATPVVEKANIANEYDAVMEISLAVISACDALLFTGASPGANKERGLIESKGKPVYFSLDEIPLP